MSPPPPRLGPRPLPLHLLWTAAILTGSCAASPSWRNGSPLWNPALWRPAAAPALEALGESLERSLGGSARPAEDFAAALAAAIRGRAAALLEGILAYRRHPYRRAVAEPPLLWSEGAARLLDYRRPGRPGGPALLAVPSLINRAYVLDLDAEQSFLRFLAAEGIAPFLLDWGRPGEAERGFSLADHVLRQERAIAAVRAATGAAPVVLGYCMGGTLAVASAARRPDAIAGLVTLAAPWDFHADGGVQGRLLAAIQGAAAALVAALGEMPVDLIQALFAALDPALVLRKFVRFAALDPESAEARRFVALEDWLNDGVPLPASVAQECMRGWYGENAPARGLWRVAGEPVLPRRIDVPALVVVPARDRIVPPASAEALAEAIPGAGRWRPSLGHIGMMASAAAPDALWRPLVRWITAQADPPRRRGARRARSAAG